MGGHLRYGPAVLEHNSRLFRQLQEGAAEICKERHALSADQAMVRATGFVPVAAAE